MLTNKDEVDFLEWQAQYVNSRGQGGIERKLDTLLMLVRHILDELTPEQRDSILRKIGE